MKANDLLSQFGDHRQRVQSAITSVCEGRGILLVYGIVVALFVCASRRRKPDD